MHMGRKVGDGIVKVSRDAVVAARKSVLPQKELSLQVHSREEVEKHTFPKGNAYVFMPTGSSPLAGILLDILKKRPDICLIAKTNLRNADHLVMLDVELNDQLVVREMMWPEDMKHFPAVSHDKTTPKLLAQAEMLLEASIEPFDDNEYKKDSRERITTLVEDAASGKAPSKTAAKAKKKDAEQDLSALLEAAIAAKKAS
jgi:non-homologous end joining protein Ku